MDQQPLSPDYVTAPLSTAQVIESLLFVASEALSIGQLARALEIVPDAVETALNELAAACATRGIRVQRNGDSVQLVSAPEAAEAVARFLGVQVNTRLSPAALEVLGIVAYRQPITRAQVEAVRGVDCGGVLRALLARELLCETGRLEAAGRPILYGTTAEFLHQFGLTSLAALPTLETPDDRQ